MRHSIVVVLLVPIISLALTCARKQEGIQWAESLEEALQVARESNQHVLVEVYTETCKWCTALAETTFADPGVVAFSGEFLWAKVDANADTQTARKHRVFGYPTTILLDPSGQEVDRIVGYLRPEPFMAQIKGYLAGQGTLGALREQVQRDSADVKLLFQLGEKYLQRGLWDQSLVLFEKVVHLDPQNQTDFSDDALSYQGEALRRMEKTDQAVAKYDELMRSYPNSELAGETPLEIGYTYQKAERNDEAIAVYRAFLQQHPGHKYEDWVNKQLQKLVEKP